MSVLNRDGKLSRFKGIYGELLRRWRCFVEKGKKKFLIFVVNNSFWRGEENLRNLGCHSVQRRELDLIIIVVIAIVDEIHIYVV